MRKRRCKPATADNRWPFLDADTGFSRLVVAGRVPAIHDLAAWAQILPVSADTRRKVCPPAARRAGPWSGHDKCRNPFLPVLSFRFVWSAAPLDAAADQPNVLPSPSAGKRRTFRICGAAFGLSLPWRGSGRRSPSSPDGRERSGRNRAGDSDNRDSRRVPTRRRSGARSDPRPAGRPRSACR